MACIEGSACSQEDEALVVADLGRDCWIRHCIAHQETLLGMLAYCTQVRPSNLSGFKLHGSTSSGLLGTHISLLLGLRSHIIGVHCYLSREGSLVLHKCSSMVRLQKLS